MSSGFKKLFVFLCMLVVCIFVSQLWLHPFQENEQAGIKSCEVYKSFYNQKFNKKLNKQEDLFFRPITHPYIQKTFRGHKAPVYFEKDTGNFKSIQSSPNKERKIPIREEFKKDTSEFFKPLLSRKALSIEHCFKMSSHQPKFYQGSYKYLNSREAFLDWLYGDDRRYITSLSVSPVGFSKDGRYALLYAEYYCNALCGGGEFYLFEMTSGSWKLIGDKSVWVS